MRGSNRFRLMIKCRAVYSLLCCMIYSLLCKYTTFVEIMYNSRISFVEIQLFQKEDVVILNRFNLNNKTAICLETNRRF